MARNIVPDIIICVIILISIAVLEIGKNILKFSLDDGTLSQSVSQLIEKQPSEVRWLYKLGLNSFGYLCVFAPGYLILQYVQKTKYLERNDPTIIKRTISFCFAEDRSALLPETIDKTNNSSSDSSVPELLKLLYCFFGLMTSYLTWGALQEKIMTKEYTHLNGGTNRFTDSQFLVFSNRVLAVAIGFAYLFFKDNRKSDRIPFYKYSFASISNIFSAWFQYEALKFVSFPTQVLAKSSKVIPVMLMGKLVSRTKYEFYEYCTAVMISCGMILFLYGNEESKQTAAITTMTGIILLGSYIFFDSFTSNWQGKLFKTYKITSMEMMCGVNVFSTVFTAISLINQGDFHSSWVFAAEHPTFIFDCLILSISSAVGQLFIFYTIASFGPVVFTIIMTTRQAASIILSCILYNHRVSTLGIFGITVIFIAILLRIYCAQRIKKLRHKTITAQSSKAAV